MKCTFLMNETQKQYAVDHHNLVYKYLRAKRLDENTYYDIIIPGYLRAVVKYDIRKELHNYRFSTIAWRAMDTNLSNYRRYLTRKKRNADVVSLDVDTTAGNDFALINKLPSGDDPTRNLDDKQFWLEVYSLLNENQIKLIQMRVNGYSRLDISRQLKIPFNDIDEALLNVWNRIKGLFDGQSLDLLPKKFIDSQSNDQASDMDSALKLKGA